MQREQHRGCGRVGSAVRRALSFFDVQVASLVGAAGLHRCQPALLGMELADGEQRKEGVSKGQPAHFMILNDSRKVGTHEGISKCSKRPK
jgi:hypothetical protein